MSVEQLVQKAIEYKADAIALTDINNSTGVPEFVAECIKHGIKPVAGIEFRNNNEFLFIGIARNNEGLRELNEFLTKHNINGSSTEFPPPKFNHTYILYSTNRVPDRKLFDNERIGIKPGEVNKLLTMKGNLKRNSMVILNPVTFSVKEDIFIHRSLRAVDNNILLSHLQPWQCADADEFFMEPNQIDAAFSRYHEIVENTKRLLDDCTLNLDLKSNKNKQLYSASRYDDKLLLEKLAWDGMVYRYGRNNSEAKKESATNSK
jgi:DNA polymerase III alpha subunit